MRALPSGAVSGIAGIQWCQIGLVEDIEEHGTNGEAGIFAEDSVVRNAEGLLCIHIGVEVVRGREDCCALRLEGGAPVVEKVGMSEVGETAVGNWPPGRLKVSLLGIARTPCDLGLPDGDCNIRCLRRRRCNQCWHRWESREAGVVLHECR